MKVFIKNQGKLMYKYAMLKRGDDKFNAGFNMAKNDLKEIEDYREATNLNNYYKGEIKI